MSDRFELLNVQHDDEQWGNIIDPLKWNENFLEIERVFNLLASDLNSGVIPDDEKATETAIYGTSFSYDIETAYQLGKVVKLVYNGKLYLMLERVDANTHIFYNITGNGLTANISVITCDNDNWSQTNIEIPAVGYLTENYATKAYVDNAILNLPDGLDVAANGNILRFTYSR